MDRLKLLLLIEQMMREPDGSKQIVAYIYKTRLDQEIESRLRCTRSYEEGLRNGLRMRKPNKAANWNQ